MIIRSLKTHWRARMLEYLMAGFLLSWGLYTLGHPEIFTNPATQTVTGYMRSMVAEVSIYPALVWGGGATLIGIGRLIALLINGHWTRTPLIRTIASLLSMFIVLQIFIGLSKSGVPNWGIVVYPWLVFADILSAFRAAVDVVHAEVQREANKESRSVARNAHFAS